MCSSMKAVRRWRRSFTFSGYSKFMASPVCAEFGMEVRSGVECVEAQLVATQAQDRVRRVVEHARQTKGAWVVDFKRQGGKDADRRGGGKDRDRIGVVGLSRCERRAAARDAAVEVEPGFTGVERVA